MNRVVAVITQDAEGHPKGFQFVCDKETVALEPHRTWVQHDHFKWATRGLIEAPQSFEVHPDGSVEFNGETYKPVYAVDAQRLTEALNKRHVTAQPPTRAHSGTSEKPRTRADRVQFRVHLDHLGHPMVEAWRGDERAETGLRGLQHFVDDGWMLRPESLHVDPLQRHIEIDGVRYATDTDGSKELERVLNSNYAPAITSHAGVAIEVRENSAASSGFDIHFWTVRAGTRFEIKGHLSQEKLDILQDHDKCDILKPGIILRLSPPYLYFRRRRRDGGEEPVPGLPDTKYRGLPAHVLQQLLNHPLIRQSSDAASVPADDSPDVVSQGSDTTGSPSPAVQVAPVEPSKAATPPVTFTPPPKSPPPSVAPVRPATPAPPTTPPPPSTQPPEDPELARLFGEKDPHRINEEIFRQLAQRLEVPVQDVLLSLPLVFDDRRFEILDFNGEEIASVLQLRTAHFYGFYLTHIGPERIDLVYACHGTHLEWGTDKCVLQPVAGAETIEHREPALLGLAQNSDNHFVFIVTTRYREWVRHFEPPCAEAFARFATPSEWKNAREEYHLIWPPEQPASSAS